MERKVSIFRIGYCLSQSLWPCGKLSIGFRIIFLAVFMNVF